VFLRTVATNTHVSGLLHEINTLRRLARVPLNAAHALPMALPGFSRRSYRARSLPLRFTRHAWPSARTVSRFHLLGHNILPFAIQHRTAYQSHLSMYPHSGAGENLKQQIATSHTIAVVGDGRTQRPVHANITAVSGVPRPSRRDESGRSGGLPERTNDKQHSGGKRTNDKRITANEQLQQHEQTNTRTNEARQEQTNKRTHQTPQCAV
jgi:hypothetical protein